MQKSKSKSKKSTSAKTPTAVSAKPKPAMHDSVKLTYAGASPTIRGHGRKLTAVRLDYAASGNSLRDQSFVRDMRAAYGEKAKAGFQRRDIDAGVIGRGITLGNVKHVSGNLAVRECVFALTDAGYQLGKPS